MNDDRRARVDCETFEADAVELSVGTVDEPHRSELLEHAAACASCREVLDEVTDLADRLLLLAPEVEPPAGFEVRALAARSGRARRSRRPWVAAAIVAAVLAFVMGVVTGTSIGDAPVAPSRAAVVLTPSLAVAGAVELDGEELTVSLGQDMPWPDEVACELRSTDGGEWVRVATWRPDPRYGGEWTTPVAGELANATEMRLVDMSEQHEVIARAFLSPAT